MSCHAKSAEGQNHELAYVAPTTANLSTPRLAELGDALDIRSVDTSPALRLFHPGCVFRKFVVYTKGTVLGFLLKEY
jgi:hypothetical protein